MAEGNYSSVQILSQLVCLLRKNGDKILQGDSKFCLTTQGLSVLNASFRRYSEIDCVIEPEYLTRNKNVKQEMLMEKWKENICFLHDFVVKTISLKIIHGSFTVQSPVILTRFRNLQCLEVKKVPVHMLEGLQILRSQLQTLIVSRCLQNIEALLETCGGDQSGPMSWPKLRWCSLNYNSIAKLDESLRLVNELEVLELSHNYICKTEDFLQYLTGVQRVNLGFNQIDSVPKFSLSSRVRLKTLVLRNNNLDNLEGIEELTGLEELDVSENCLSDHRLLSVLSPLHKLQLLNLLGNPLAYHDHHRIITVSYISHSVLRKNFFLDKKRVKSSEIVYSQYGQIILYAWAFCPRRQFRDNHLRCLAELPLKNDLPMLAVLYIDNMKST